MEEEKEEEWEDITSDEMAQIQEDREAYDERQVQYEQERRFE